jgi:hypothetical protein
MPIFNVERKSIYIEYCIVEAETKEEAKTKAMNDDILDALDLDFDKVLEVVSVEEND